VKIDVRFRHFEVSGGLREHVIRRIHFQLSRFGRQISSVTVRVGDVNGPRGGADKRCRVALRGPGLGSIAFEEQSGDACSAVEVALERAARSVGRELEKARSRARPLIVQLTKQEGGLS
jgi:putative sigma-54 modulation protein